MADEQRLKVVIEATAAGLTDALKQATSAVNGSTASWKTRLDDAQASIKTAQDAVKNLGETAKSLRDANVDISGIPGLVDRIDQAGGSLEGLKADIDQAVDGLSRLRAEGSSLGIGFEEYQRFSEVLGEVGMSSEQFRSVMTQMQSSVHGLADGVPEAVELFGRLGVSMQDLANKSPAGQMEAIANAVNALSDPMIKAEASNRLFATSLEDVVRLGEAYRKSIELGTGGTYATDADLNRLVQMQRQLNGLQESMAGVQRQASESGGTFQQAMTQSLDAIDRVRGELEKLSQAYLSAAGVAGDTASKTVQAWDKVQAGVSSVLDEMGQMTQTAIEQFNRIVSENPSLGMRGMVDPGSSQEVLNLIQSLRPLIDSLDEGDAKSKQLANSLSTALLGMQTGAQGMQDAFDTVFGAIESHLSDIRNKAESGVELRVKTDTRELHAVDARVSGLRAMFKGIRLNEDLETKVRSLRDAVDQTMRTVARCNVEIDRLNEEANRLVGFGERISGSFRNAGRSIVSFLQHPIQSVHDGILRTMDAVNGLGNASAQAGQQGASNAKQIIGMLAGVASMAGGVVKAVKMVWGFIKGYWIDPMKEAWKDILRMSEHRLGLNKGVYGSEADRWKSAKQELQEYYELLKKAQSEEGTSEDREKERQARRNLERNYAIEINPDGPDVRIAVGRELDKAQANYVKALEGQERELAKAQDEAQKALERVTSYWKSGIWYGGNWNAYQADVLSVQDKINALAKEYDSVRLQLHQARKETAGEDFRRIEGAKMDDKAREARRKEAERAGKSFEDKAKKREEATEDLDKWASETMQSEGQRRLDQIYDRYEKLLLAGVPKSQADPIRDEAIKKELERQAKEDAEALKREADEHKRHLDALQHANEQEEDARRRMLEAYRAWYEAQERQTYELRLDRLGKAQERLRRKLDGFGFSLPQGWRRNPGTQDRRTARLDKSIAEKLSRQASGERVHFTKREQDRIDEYKALRRKGRNLSAEEKAIRAAQRQDAAAKTMKSASDAFWEAVKAFYKAATGKDLETKNERRARERREKREKSNRENAERRRNPMRSRKWSDAVNGGNGHGGVPKPAEPRPAPRPAPAPAPKPSPAPAPRPAGEPLPPVFLDFDQYLKRFGGDRSKADDYYRKYVEQFNLSNGTSHEAVIPEGFAGWDGARNLEELYAPGRTGSSIEAPPDYTDLLKRIANAVEGDKNTFTVK